MTKNANTKTPLAIVKERFGDKSTLVNELAGKIERKDGESKGDLQARLSKVSSTKLLGLHKLYEEVDKVGGRKALVDSIYSFRTGSQAKEDKGLKDHLNKKTIGALFDEYQVIQKKQRAQNR